ncbi:hypothetical protein AJ80_01287 [Polytolypa hystricis UAMH7299]|uniref:JmjC domain-containing protein n=1 Tax=Polytolypa hystricis (strain UAMH7299) TaxID=1447883 RepID=A0A2B7Z0Z8_POLH7|nr:hypothetical protein AJ80_01287 [Polytolypa hystricis UAMH7299]
MKPPSSSSAARIAQSAAAHFAPLPTLSPNNAAIDTFRTQYFQPQRPVVLPRGHFSIYPAIDRWFTQHKDGSTELNYAYLDKYAADCHVPLELTSPVPPNGSSSSSEDTLENSQTEDPTESFKRFLAPLALFLQWTRTVTTTTNNNNNSTQPRLYLAQCQLLDLPSTLRADFPTPSFVTDTGKGDIYDTNIWLGIPPTYTPLHRDPNPNLFVQLAGRKTVRLLAPDEGLGVFRAVRERIGDGVSSRKGDAVFRGEEMMRGVEREELESAVWGGGGGEEEEQHPASSSTTTPEPKEKGGTPRIQGYEATLNAGDAMFIPLGWWHSIKGVGEGVTASVNWWFR